MNSSFRDPIVVFLYLFLALTLMYVFVLYLMISSLLLGLRKVRSRLGIEDPAYFYYSVFLSGRLISPLHSLMSSCCCSAHCGQAILVGSFTGVCSCLP